VTGLADPAALRLVVDRVARVPARHRAFTTPHQRARQFYRIPGPVLDQLLDLGFPHQGGGTGLVFDRNDLRSASLILGLRSPQRTAFLAMAGALAAAESNLAGAYAMRIEGSCPEPGHPGDCGYALSPAVRRSPAVLRLVAADPGRFALDLRVGPGGRLDLTLSAGQRRLVEEAARLQFHLIPKGLTGDLGFAAETGLADCTLAMRFLAARGAELGVAVRGATGLCLSRPFANRHCWLELRQAGRWLPADPFFLNALAGWGLIDGAAWPPHRCPAGAYWRLEVGVDEPVVTHRAAGAGPDRPRDSERLGPAYFLVRPAVGRSGGH